MCYNNHKSFQTNVFISHLQFEDVPSYMCHPHTSGVGLLS